VKPEEVAQTLLPSLLKMAALSTLPVPTRLEDIVLAHCFSSEYPVVVIERAGTFDRRMLHEEESQTLAQSCLSIHPSIHPTASSGVSAALLSTYLAKT